VFSLPRYGSWPNIGGGFSRANSGTLGESPRVLVHNHAGFTSTQSVNTPRIGSTSCACKLHCPHHRCSIDIAAVSASIHAVKSCCCEVLKVPDRQEATIWTTVTHLNHQQTRCQTREKPATARPRPSGSGIASTSTIRSSRTRSSALSLHHLSTPSLRLPHPPRRPHHDPHPSPHYTHPP
jgi:hypothetical protein